MSKRSRDLLAIEGGTPVLPNTAHRRWPEITQTDRAAIAAVLDRGETCGPHAAEVSALAAEYAAYCGARHCLPVNSGTAALHCAVVASGVRPGDEVITSAVSFVATPMAIIHAGATPVFADIDPRTYNVDPESVADLITDRTAAILPVHVHGLVADIDAIQRIARRSHLAVIEDAAQAHGATYRGRKAGTLGVCAGFSLNGEKAVSAGEGGLFVTNDEQALKAAQRLAMFGEDTPAPEPGELRAYWSRGVGWNYRMHEITAAMARAQLPRLDAYNATARRNAALLTEGIRELEGFEPPYIPPGVGSAYYGYRFRFDPSHFGWNGAAIEFRDRLLYALLAEGVAIEPWQFMPLPAQPLFRRDRFEQWRPGSPDKPIRPWDPTAYPEASRLFSESLCLGPHPHPLYVQDERTMALYVEALRKVHHRMDAVLAASYKPVRVTPAIPTDEL